MLFVDFCCDVVHVLETLSKDGDGSSVTVEITTLDFCFKSVYIWCQRFVVPLLDFNEM